MKINNFLKNGFLKCGKILKKNECSKIINSVKKNRNLENVFLTKKDYLKINNKHSSNNPGPGRNYLHKLDTKFIFDNLKYKNLMSKILGNHYRILDFKLVMGVPENIIPNWITKMTKNNNTINLGRFVKPKYRDITYFKGIDFHQDIIDWPSRSADFITAYIYLENVNIH